MKKIALIGLGVVGVCGAFALVACSSGGTTDEDSGVTPKMDGSISNPDTGNNNNDSGMMMGNDSGPDCGTTATLHPEMEAGVYCPFSAGDGGKAITCAPTEHCCEPAMGTSTCVSKNAMCPAMTTDWQCLDQPDCPNQKCCGVGTPAGPDPGCTNLFVTGFKGTKCAASCGMGEFQVCENDNQCPMGMKCMAAKAKGNQFGICK